MQFLMGRDQVGCTAEEKIKDEVKKGDIQVPRAGRALGKRRNKREVRQQKGQKQGGLQMRWEEVNEISI